MAITPDELALVNDHPMVEACVQIKPQAYDQFVIAVSSNPEIYVRLKVGFGFANGHAESRNGREGHFKTYNDFLQALPMSLSIIESKEKNMHPLEPLDTPDLTALAEEQCQAFRSLPLKFNDMVRAIYRAGYAKGSADAMAKLQPLVKDIDEQLGTEECNNCELASEAIGNLEAEKEQISAATQGA
jgi:hypothetical protein